MKANPKAILIAAPRSGAGKTTGTLALLAAFRRRGLRVRAAKCGPDYIDPAFHQAASGAPCLNLDSWAMGPALLESLVHEAAAGADLLIVESAMGLFDGAGGAAMGEGAAAELAIRFRLPVLLVLDVAGQAQSAAAVVHGFARFDPRVQLAGVVLNRVGSDRHRAMIERAIATLGIPWQAPFRATRPCISPNAISGSCKRWSIMICNGVSTAWPISPSAIAISPSSKIWHAPLQPSHTVSPPWRRRGNASRSRATRPSPLSIRIY